MSSTASKLFQLIQDRNLSINDIAKSTEIKIDDLVMFFLEKQDISFDDFFKICKSIGTDLDTVLYYDIKK